VAKKIQLGNGIVNVNTDAQEWERGAPERSSQGRRRRACGLAMAADQPPAERDGSWQINKRQNSQKARTGRRTGAARRGWPPCRRSIKWNRGEDHDIFAEFESHGSAAEVEATRPAGRGGSSDDVVSGVVRDQAKLDPLIDDALSSGGP